jgi:hypothetical protein
MGEGTETDEEPLIRRPRAKRKTEAVEEKSPKRRETETEEEAPTASKTKKNQEEEEEGGQTGDDGSGRGALVETIVGGAPTSNDPKNIAVALGGCTAENG